MPHETPLPLAVTIAREVMGCSASSSSHEHGQRMLEEMVERVIDGHIRPLSEALQTIHRVANNHLNALVPPDSGTEVWITRNLRDIAAAALNAAKG